MNRILVASVGLVALIGLEQVTRPRALIGQGVSTNVTHYFVAESIDGPHFGLVAEIAGLSTPGAPSYKVAGYFAAETGLRGDDIYPLNAVAMWNPGDPRSNVIAFEADIGNNNRDVGADDTPYVTGALLMSGGEYHPGRAAIIAAMTQQNAWRVGLDVLEGSVTDAGLRIGGPTPGNTGAAILRQLANGRDTVLVQRQTDFAPRGSLLRGVMADNTRELFDLTTDGNLSLWGTGETLNLGGHPAFTNINFFGGAQRQRSAAIQAALTPNGGMLSFFVAPIGGNVIRALTITDTGDVIAQDGTNLSVAVRQLQAEVDALKRRVGMP